MAKYGSLDRADINSSELPINFRSLIGLGGSIGIESELVPADPKQWTILMVATKRANDLAWTKNNWVGVQI
jgi:hypothetical protein